MPDTTCDNTQVEQKLQSGVQGDWTCSIDGRPTFLGALEECYDECSKYWRKESTRTSYARDYSQKILPNISDHNTRSLDSYTTEDFDVVISKIEKAGQSRANNKSEAYSPNTIRHFRHLIYVVVKAAAKVGLCDDVLWGSKFSVSESISNKDEEKQRAKLKKSLSVREEIAVAKFLIDNYLYQGQYVGLLLMFALGLRNNEACATNYEDIKPMQHHPLDYVLWVYKSTKIGSSELKSSGKTHNADRVIPVPPLLYKLIMERKEMIKQQLEFAEETQPINIDTWPIVCFGDDYTRRCSTNNITAAGRTMFKNISLDEKMLAYLDDELSNDMVSDEIVEKDPSAYLLRRNFATQMYILGLTEAEIQYVLGHDVEDAYETRNEFVNEDKQYDIKLKMDQRAIFNDIFADKEKQVDLSRLDKGSDSFKNISSLKLTIPIKPNSLYDLQLKALEPQSAIHVRLRCFKKAGINLSVRRYASTRDYGRTINVLAKYHSLYRKYTTAQVDNKDE